MRYYAAERLLLGTHSSDSTGSSEAKMNSVCLHMLITGQALGSLVTSIAFLTCWNEMLGGLSFSCP